MGQIVVKFGGTSVADLDRIRAAAATVKAEVERGNQVAVVVSAIYGILLASSKKMDFVGLFVVASAVAFGGGTIRDLCLDRTPLS